MKVSYSQTIQLRSLRRSVKEDLLGNILPFWFKLERDEGYVGALRNDLQPVEQSPVGLVMLTRLLWTYSRAYRMIGDRRFVEFAERLYDYLVTHFEDKRSGGYAWRLNAEGQVLDGKKQTYGQAFTVYAFSEYHLATGNTQVLDKAIELFELMENHCWKVQSGGYWEATDSRWDLMEDVRLSEKDKNAPLSMNTHLHVMEAYANLLLASKYDKIAEASERVLGVVITRILHPDGNRLGLFYDAKWNLLSQAISPGHDIEGSWLMWESAQILNNPELIEKVRPVVLKMADFVLSDGVDSDGSILNEYEPGQRKQKDRDWWPQAEGVVGFLNAFQMTGNENFLNACIKTWSYIQESIIDRDHGEWLAGRKENGEPQDSEKAGPWKSSYHNGRMGFEVINRVNDILRNIENE